MLSQIAIKERVPLLLASALFLLFAPCMHAGATYFYCGSTLTGSNCMGASGIQASFTIDGPLAANVTESITPITWEMGSPNYVYPTPPGNPNFTPSLTLDVSTDASGNIVDWYMLAEAGGDQVGAYVIETCNDPAVFSLTCQTGNNATALDYYQFTTHTGNHVDVNTADDPGSWSVSVFAPEPGPGMLTGFGSFALIAIAWGIRRRSRAQLHQRY